MKKLDDKLVDEITNLCMEKGITGFGEFQEIVHSLQQRDTRQRIKAHLGHYYRAKNDDLEFEKRNNTMRSSSRLSIIQPKEDEVCVENLVIEIKTTLKHQEAELFIMDINNKEIDSSIFNLKKNKIISYKLKNLKPGRYYWRLTIGRETRVDSVFFCSPIHYAMLENSLALP